MLLVPDPATALIDPFHEYPTLSLICDVRDPITGEWYSRDPRHVARKAEAPPGRDSGIADTAYFGPEAEFYIFDHVAYGQAGQPRLLRGRLARGLLERRAPASRRNGERPLANLAYTQPLAAGLLPGRRRSTRSPTCAAG